jgi:hypothetical protein
MAIQNKRKIEERQGLVLTAYREKFRSIGQVDAPAAILYHCNGRR